MRGEVLNRADRRARAKLDRTIVRPRPSRNALFRMAQARALAAEQLAKLPPKLRAFVDKYGADAYREIVEALREDIREAEGEVIEVGCPLCGAVEAGEP